MLCHLTKSEFFENVSLWLQWHILLKEWQMGGGLAGALGYDDAANSTTYGRLQGVALRHPSHASNNALNNASKGTKGLNEELP